MKNRKKRTEVAKFEVAPLIGDAWLTDEGKTPVKRAISVTIAALFVCLPAFGQSASTQKESQTNLKENESRAQIVVTGTRVSNRSVLDTPSAIDVVSAETLSNVGVTELSQSLASTLPAFNFPRPGLTDGTDTVRPVTLRGLAPDQVLVLVNSKRRHSSALVNVNGTVGRGSASADLNTIPSSIIKNVEILRDGAAAQYGSDAIAGVINMRLREDRKGGELTLSSGIRKTEYEFNPGIPASDLKISVPSSRKRSDGQSTTLSGWKGFALGDSGFLTVAAELKNQEHTERSGYDVRQQYPKIGSNYDPRELTINRFNVWSGEPEVQQATVFANAGYTLENGVKTYGSASYQLRESKSAGFFRRPLQDENVLSIYPDGYLPFITPTVEDFSVSGGANWDSNGWELDASVGFGKNRMAFGVENSLNRSIGPTSKTEFDAGGFSYDQLTLNISGVKGFPMPSLASPLNVAVGAEARQEDYQLWAGEPDSYRHGGALLSTGKPTAAGAQVFPGYTPQNAVSNGRNSVGAFLDLETKFTKEFLASLAIRGERYSDFGNNVTGKFAGRYDFTSSFALRGSVQNGFRAPSPQQQFYTSTSMTFIDGVAFNIATFRPSDPVAVALGAKPLAPEKSINFSLGSVLRIGKISLTIDGYEIKINNRIVLSENLTQANVRTFLTGLGYTGVGGARFFINGVDSTTKGADIVANYPLKTEKLGLFDITVAGNFNKTEVTRVPTTAELAALNPAPSLFGRANVIGAERGQPKNKVSVNLAWKLDKYGVNLNATRYGEVMSAGSTAATDFIVDPATVVNLEGRYQLSENLRLAIGADNLFDVYSDPLPASLNSTGAVVYANRAPFGRSGRYLYARLAYKF